MKLRSLTLGAIVLGLMAPAAFAASAGNGNCVYRDKNNNGGQLCMTTGKMAKRMLSTEGFAVRGEVQGMKHPIFSDEWPGKSTDE